VKTLSLVLVAAFVLFQSASVHAAGIYQMEYRYSFDDMARDGAHRQAFVICDDTCAAGPPLAPAPRFPALSIKVSQNPPTSANREVTPMAPVGGNSETAAIIAKSNGPQDPDTRVTVLFSLDSSALGDAEKARLSSFAKGLDAEAKDSKLFVTGYTCDLGNKAHNDYLAMNRAEAVEGYLRKAGLHAIWVAGRGKCCYATKDPGKRYLNRRVEVAIDNKEATK
jgi:outer membrane protein OmpA-like peptidoglycan-associated protein